ncbi:MAG: hypothetical protein SWH54_11180 [Thermodesulfobacteriota bacterium]|nr:hypothetical protein [Thermodesulfobacteriota bacterium]
MSTWSIGCSELERFEVTLLSPAAKDEGYDWISARASVAVGGFRGDASLMLTLTDLIRFQQELHSLYRDLKGEAELTTVEDQVSLKLSTDGLGNISATGHLMDQAGVGNRLTFTLNLDQTFLKETISELDTAIENARE